MEACQSTQRKCSSCLLKLEIKASQSHHHLCSAWCHWSHSPISDQMMVSSSVSEFQFLSVSRPVCSGFSLTPSHLHSNSWVFSLVQATQCKRKELAWSSSSLPLPLSQAKPDLSWWLDRLLSQETFKDKCKWKWDLLPSLRWGTLCP